MLSRAASRTLRSRPAPLPFPRTAPLASTSRLVRAYADTKRPPQSPGNSQTWKKGDGIKFAPPKNQDPSPNPVHPKQQPEFDAAATPERNTVPQSKRAGPGVTETVDAKSGKPQAYTKEQEEFAGPQSAAENTAPTTEQPQKPLPDLRQGIPSTFAAEFAKEQEAQAKQDHDPNNITDDPAREPSAGGSGGREGGELPKSAYETSTDRRRNRVANIGYALTAVAGVLGAVYFGRNWETEEEEKAHADAPSGWGLGLMYARAKARLNSQMGYYTEPTFPKLLPTMDPQPPYTLVISLEDLLIHSEWTTKNGWRTAKRPGVDYFLRYLSQYYELVIFTSQPMAIAEPVIRKLDPFRVVMWPLFREATRYEKGEYIKDLSYLNRDLSKTIIIDTNPSHTKLQPENAIILPKWNGQPGDKGLVSLIPFLEYIAMMGVADVRTAIQSFEGKDVALEFAKREAKAREAFNKQLAEEESKKPKRSAGSWVAKQLGVKPQPQQVAADGTPVALEPGKFIFDQIRERGQKQYEIMDKEIRENGEKWLKEMAEEEKKFQEEQMKSMKSGVFGWLGGPGAQQTPAAGSERK